MRARPFGGKPEWCCWSGRAQRKNLIAIVIYAVAIPVAYYRTTLSLALIFLVALLYAVPSLWVERCADVLESKEAHRAGHGELHEPYTGRLPIGETLFTVYCVQPSSAQCGFS